MIGGFATLTMLTKNCFLEELPKQFVTTARAKGISERRVLYGHVFRNAMLIVIAGFPPALISILFTGALLIEVIFGLNGMGLLGFEAALGRDYPVLFGTLYCFTLLALLLHLLGDLVYTLVDPRIDFESREALAAGRRSSVYGSPRSRGGGSRASRRTAAATTRCGPWPSSSWSRCLPS